MATKAKLNESQIKELQTALIKAGYDVGSTGADGVIGKNTQAAIDQWYDDNNWTKQKSGGLSTNAFKKITTGSVSGNTNTGTVNKTITGTQPVIESSLGTKDAQTSAYEEQIADLQAQNNTLSTDIQSLYAQMANMQNTGNDSLEQAKATSAENINSQYDDAARNYYKLYKSQLAQSPEYLSRVGATGGASETYNLGLLNNYSGNLLSNESSRNTALADSNITYDTQIAANTKDAADTLASYYYQLSQQAISDKKEKEEEAKAQTVTNWNNGISNKVSELLKNGKTVYMWTDSDGKYHYNMNIANAAASGYNYTRLNSQELLKQYTATNGGSTGSTGTKDTTKKEDAEKKDDKGTGDGSYTITTNNGITLTFAKNGDFKNASGNISNGDYFTGSDGVTWYYNNGQWSTKGQASKTGADANSTVFNGYRSKITKLFTEPSNGIVNSNTKAIAYTAIDNFDVSEAQKQELYAWADALYAKTKS